MAKTKEGNYFLDANPLYFGEILEYLRHGEIITKDPGLLRGVKKLACYFGLTELLQELECENDSKWVILDLQRKKEVEMSIATLTKFEDSTLAKFFLGDEEAKKVLSPWIKKENENRYFIARPLKKSENVFTFLSSYTFYMKTGKGYEHEMQEFEEELELYGLSEKYRSEIGDDSSYDFIYQWKYDSSYDFIQSWK